jgi:PAS domain S-box-containing protein
MVQPTPIKRRLILVILLTSLTALALAATAFVLYELAASTGELQNHVEMAAQIIADQVTSRVLDEPPGGADDLLASLRFVPSVDAAALYNSKGVRIASYPRTAPPERFAAAPPHLQKKRVGHTLMWAEPVLHQGKRVATLYVEANLTPVYSRLPMSTWIGVAVMGASLVVALFLSNYLQRGISQPILALAETARFVSERRDYSVRARKVSNDELGLLTDAFNHMLGQIQDGEAALREQTQLLDLANVLVRDLQNRIILWSAGMEQLYGWARTEALGKVSHQLLSTEFMQPLEEITQTVLREGEWTGELLHRRRDGARLMVASRWVLHKDPDGHPAAILEINNDITARKVAEEEIRRLNADLEVRVHERTVELTETNRELEAFTYSVSHDLRAPVRHIDAFARILEEELSGTVDPQVRSYLARIRKGTQTMGRLVDDLLNLSRVGRAPLGRQTVDLNALVQDVLTELRGELGSRQIEWRLQTLPDAACDPGLMKQVFANLLSNAVKYTRPRPQAVIEVGQTIQGDELVLFVRDNGVGFNMRYVDKLFGVFERLHRPDEFEGTGIGLAVVRRIVQKHGGRIWAEAEPNKGATFYFTFAGLQRAETGMSRLDTVVGSG